MEADWILNHNLPSLILLSVEERLKTAFLCGPSPSKLVANTVIVRFVEKGQNEDGISNT